MLCALCIEVKRSEAEWKSRFENNFIIRQLLPCLVAPFWSINSNLVDLIRYHLITVFAIIARIQREPQSQNQIDIKTCARAFSNWLHFHSEHLFWLDSLVAPHSSTYPNWPRCHVFSSWPLINCSYYPHDIVGRGTSTTIIHYKEINRSNYR